jgi:hypothetical protein
MTDNTQGENTSDISSAWVEPSSSGISGIASGWSIKPTSGQTLYTASHEFVNALSKSISSKEPDLWLSTPSGRTRIEPYLWNDAIAAGIALTQDIKPVRPVILMHNGAGVLLALFHGGKAFIQVTLGEG